MTPDRKALDGLRIDRSQAARRRPRIWLPVAMIVLLVLAVAATWRMVSSPAIAEVRAATVRETAAGAGSTVLNASGYVTARRRATVSSKVTGKVVEVLIEEGLQVDAGQVLARLDTTNLDASLALAQARLASARSALQETEVRIAEARLQLGRSERLVRDGVASQLDLDTARAEVDALSARLERQREEIEVASSEVRLWQRQVADMTIRAPFSGVIVSKDAQPGEMISPVSAGGGFTRTGIGTIVDMESLEIEVDVNESYINRVQAGQRVEAILDAYPDWKIPTRVIAIVPTADRQKATVRVRIGFEELDARILPDMGVKVAFQEPAGAATSEARIEVPAAAVRQRDGKELVFVLRDGRVERRAVTSGETRNGTTTIVAGLTPGERVVVEGPADLADGDEIKELDR